jgi:hypothetical protein
MPDPGNVTGAAIQAPVTASAPADGDPQPTPDGFGHDGAAEYQRFASEYLTRLDQLSRVSAQNRESEAVSPFDVRWAAGMLRGGRAAKGKHASEIGTLLIGASLAYLGSVIYGSAYTFANGMLIFLPLLVGCILYTYSWNRD